jgi:hypothetical protein
MPSLETAEVLVVAGDFIGSSPYTIPPISNPLIIAKILIILLIFIALKYLS